MNGAPRGFAEHDEQAFSAQGWARFAAEHNAGQHGLTVDLAEDRLTGEAWLQHLADVEAVEAERRAESRREAEAWGAAQREKRAEQDRRRAERRAARLGRTLDFANAAAAERGTYIGSDGVVRSSLGTDEDRAWRKIAATQGILLGSDFEDTPAGRSAKLAADTWEIGRRARVARYDAQSIAPQSRTFDTSG